jgi:arylsulfatase A-like enzyme
MLADDLGFADVSFHWQQPSQAQIPTPHLQKLAEEGTVLQHYYVQPVCSPTRATILTGRHATSWRERAVDVATGVVAQMDTP